MDEADKRLWIGNLDSRISEFNLLKILQKCGEIEKFDMLFYKTGPNSGLPRGYAFVTYKRPQDRLAALDKLNGIKVGEKHVVVRAANKMTTFEETESTKPKIAIPALSAGAGGSKQDQNGGGGTLSKEAQIRALEAKLKQLESSDPDFEINQTVATNPPLIQKYQYNKDKPAVPSMKHNKYSKTRHKSRPYDRRR